MDPDTMVNDPMMMAADDDPGGVRDGQQLAVDAPGTAADVSPAGMELTFPTSADPAAFEQGHVVIPETVQEDSSSQDQKEEKRISFQPSAAAAAANTPKQSTTDDQQPTQFREQFDHLMIRLEDRFQGERLGLEEKHSRELEEAMGYFSLSSGEREAKQQELQISLLEDIGSMAQQLHELTGALGPENDVENMTLPSDPKVLEEYARKMQGLEEHFQKEKLELEQKHATEMEQALGTLKMTSGQREAKQLELQDQLSSEIGDMAKQLEELNSAKAAYEDKMGVLKQQLTKEDTTTKQPSRTPEDPDIRSISQRLSGVERERDQAQDELRRLKLALEVTGTPKGLQRNTNPTTEGRLSPQERETISSLRGRIEQIELELKQAAQAPGGSNTMKHLRERMALIEKDLVAAEESTKEQFALENLRTRMEKVERLLTEGERAAKDWEALDELRNKIGNVDSDLKAVEEAKKEFEALEALRSKMEEVESELKTAERLASDRENVKNLRARLGQVERELGVAEPSGDDGASVHKLISRLAKAERSLDDARESTNFDEIPYLAASGDRGMQKVERDHEVETILERLALAEKKLQAAKESAQRRNPSGGYADPSTQSRYSTRPPSVTPFDERQSRIRAKLEGHLEENDPTRRAKPKEPPSTRANLGREPPSATEYSLNQNTSPRQRAGRESRSKFEEPRSVGGRSGDRYYVEDVQLDRGLRLRPRYEEEAVKSQPREPMDTDDKVEPNVPKTAASTTRPLRRRRPGEASEMGITPPPYSVFGEDDEGKYVADLEELRYQRALLSQKFPKNKMAEEEEKKSDDQEAAAPKYSFKEALRNEERQRMREKIYQRDKSSPKQKDEEPKAGGDPPTVAKEENTDPPSAVKDLQDRLALYQTKSGADPSDPTTESEDIGRTSVDPPDEVDPSVPTQKAANVEVPSDEATVEVESVGTAVTVEKPANVTPTSPPEESLQQSQKTLWWDRGAKPEEQILSKAAPPQTLLAPSPPQPPASRQPVIHQTTVVEGKAAERAHREKDRVMRWVVLVMFFVAIVLAVVIVVVVFLLRDDDNDTKIGPTPFPTMAPSVCIGSECRSMAPSSSEAPSSSTAPSNSMPPVSFEGCPDLEDDRPLMFDGVTTNQSTAGAMFDASELGACGSIEEVGSDGVWYYLFGSGDSVTLHTCTLFFPSFDTQMLVYTPMDPMTGCESGLECVTSNDDFCGLQSSVTFQAARGSVYFVYISGKTNTPVTSNPSEGEFSLSVYASPEGSCEGAFGPLEIQPDDDGQLPVVVVGSLMSGTFGVDPCSPELASRTGELWYTVVGTGSRIVASTCHSVSNFPARLAVYSGACDNLVCETANDEDCGFGSELSWFAETGVAYNLLVYSPNFVPDVTFGITVKEA